MTNCNPIDMILWFCLGWAIHYELFKKDRVAEEDSAQLPPIQTRPYEQFVKDTAKFGLDSSNLIHFTLGLGEEAGEALGKVKRIIRDDGGKLTPERRKELLKEIGDNHYYGTCLVLVLDSNWDEVEKISMEKITDRISRGVLQGEGDNR